MKKLIVFLISLLCVNVAFAKKNNSADTVQYLQDGGVKFHLENKKAPKESMGEKTGMQCWEKILQESGIAEEDFNMKTQSRVDGKLVCLDRNACFEGILTAFDKHYSLVLSPDMIWLLISQGIATQINEHAQELRGRLVDFEGQKTLKIITDRDLLQNEEDWDWIIQAFSDSIDKNMKAQFSDLMVCNFSTTGPVERISSQITMMESVKKFFKYEIMYMGCGIPDITLLGKSDDWKEIRSRIARLDDLGLDWWRKQLEPVLDEFVNASEGKVNRRFWLNMVKQIKPDESKHGGCLSIYSPAEYDGWFTVFFPFYEDSSNKIARTPKVVTHDTKVCSEIKKVDVLYSIVGLGPEEIHHLELWAGFIGMEQNWEDKSLKPVISWMMREKSSKEFVIDKLSDEDRELLEWAGKMGSLDSKYPRVMGCYIEQMRLFATRFPDIPMSENYPNVDKGCDTYLLISLDPIKVPSDLGEWCRKKNITHVTVKAPMTDDQVDDILRQVPGAQVVVL